MESNLKWLWPFLSVLASWIVPGSNADGGETREFYVACPSKNCPDTATGCTKATLRLGTIEPKTQKDLPWKRVADYFNISNEGVTIESGLIPFQDWSVLTVPSQIPETNYTKSCLEGFLNKIVDLLNAYKTMKLVVVCQGDTSQEVMQTKELGDRLVVYSVAYESSIFSSSTAGTNSQSCSHGKIEPQVGLNSNNDLNSFSKTSVLFVSISFIILMVISLAWLLFYYVQRFRYAHAKDRLARRLFNAAKKALTKIPAKTLKPLDKELDADCPVCIEPYRTNDVIRILPCRHVFHKTCVDPWLLEHRTCPMCKMDILKAFGYQFCHSEDSVQHLDGDQLSGAPSTTDGRNSFPLPLSTESDLHDPFLSSPAPSPSYVQPVLHQSNAKGYAIIPLSVHGHNGRGSDSSDSSYHLTGYSHKFHRGASAEIHQRQNSTSSAECSSNSSSLQGKRRSNSGASRSHPRPSVFKSIEAVITPPATAATIVANKTAATFGGAQPFSLTRVIQTSSNTAVVKLGQRSYSLPGVHSDSPSKNGSAAKYFGVDSSSVDSV